MSFASSLFNAETPLSKAVFHFVELSPFNAYLPYPCRMRLPPFAVIPTRVFSSFFDCRNLPYAQTGKRLNIKIF